MEYIIKKFRKITPDKALLDDLRKTAKKLHKDTLTYREYEHGGKFAAKTMCVRFSGWNAALAKAGLKVTRVLHIQINDLMQNLKEVWESLGRQPSYGEMVKPVSLYTAGTYAKRYGSWKKALREFVRYVYKQEYDIMRKAKKRKLKPRKKPSIGLRYAILKRDKYRCRICGRSPATHPGLTLHIDHIIPVSKGGETTMEDLQTLCDECNLGKSDKLS